MLIKFPIHHLFNCDPKGPNISIDAYIAEEILGWIGGMDHRNNEENNGHLGDYIWLTEDGKYTNLYCTYDASCTLEECYAPSFNKDQATFALKNAMSQDRKLFVSVYHSPNSSIVKAFGINLLEKDMIFSDTKDGKRYVLEVANSDMCALAICRVLMMWRESRRPLYRLRFRLEKMRKFIFGDRKRNDF